MPKANEVGLATKVGVVGPEPEVNVKLKLSIADEGLLPEPVVAAKVTILIQIGPALLSKAVPKSTLMLLFENNPPPVVKVPVAVAAVNVVGDAPNP